jgi:hypothetical protein
MGLNLAGNICLFSVCVTKLPGMVLAVNIFFENYWNIRIWTIGTHFLTIVLSEYRKFGHQVRKTIGLSDIRYQTQTIRLSNFGYIKKTVDCPALVTVSFWYGYWKMYFKKFRNWVQNSL